MKKFLNEISGLGESKKICRESNTRHEGLDVKKGRRISLYPQEEFGMIRDFLRNKQEMIHRNPLCNDHFYGLFHQLKEWVVESCLKMKAKSES